MKKPFYTTLLVGTFLLLPRYVLAATEQPKPLPSTFLFDQYMSPYASSPLLMSARTALNRAEDWLWQQPPAHWGQRLLSSVCNNLANDLLMLTSHEVNGHGFRVRSFHQPVNGYGLSFVLHSNPLLSSVLPILLPMNSLGGCAKYGVDAKFYGDQDMLVSIGGNEANSVLANEIIFKHLGQGYLDHRDYNLFFKAFTNLLGYVVLLPLNGDHPGNDVVSYMSKLEDKHGYQGVNATHIGLGCLTFFLNPMLYRSIGSFYAYLFKGETKQPIPYYSVGEAHYMPIIRMGLTPFGLMYYLDNFMNYQERTFLASLQLGSSSFHSGSYGGLQLKTDRLWSYKNYYSLGLEGHVWYQPPLCLAPEDSLEDKNYWGGLIGLANQLRVSKYLSLNTSILYKTSGFVEGVTTAEGALWRAGFTLHY